MSVKVEYAPQPSPPIGWISAGYHDNRLHLSPLNGLLGGQVAMDGEGRGAWFHLDPKDARALAAALIEWADAVGA